MSQPTFSFTTTAEEVATAFASEIRGKNVLVTGISVNGLGFETARVLAKHANFVIITGYNSERLKIAEDAIKNEVPSANVRPLILDLSSLAAIRKAAAEVNAFPQPLHVYSTSRTLINSAATTIGPFKLTADNIESQFATNHIGPFLLTKLLSSKPLATRTAQYTPRVVFISAASHAFRDGLNFSTLERPDPKDYDALNAYFQTKVANVLTGNVYSLHPGAIYTNILQKGEVATGLDCGTFDPGFNDNPGAYLENCIVANEKIAPHSSDPENAERLWILTEKITGERFTF